MNQFRYYFNTTRIPQEGSDKIDAHFKTVNEGSCPQHIVVLHKGKFDSLDHHKFKLKAVVYSQGVEQNFCKK